MTWPLALVVALAIAVWSLVLLDRYRVHHRLRTAANNGESWTSVYVIIVLSWLFWVLPFLVGLVQVGRPATQFTVTVGTHLQTYLQTGISSVLVLLCCNLILKNVHRAPGASVWRLAALLAPWFAIVVLSGVNAGYISGRQFLLYPLLSFTMWLVSPPLRVIRTVGILGALTAATSLVAGFLTPLALVSGGAAGIDKAILGNGQHLLAGPYSDANGFAITLALAAPCLLVVRSRRLRIGGLVVIALALLWTAGRTSLLAGAVGVSVYILGGRLRPNRLRLAGLTAAGIAFALTVLTPFLDTNPRAFSERGVIWSLSLADWGHHFLLGGGPLYYERSGLLSSSFSFKVIIGHNLMVDSLVRGGIVGAAAVALLLFVALREALRLVPISAFPIAFVVTFAFVSWLEVPLNLTNLGFLGYASWIPLTVIVLARDAPQILPVRKTVDAQLEVVTAWTR